MSCAKTELCIFNRPTPQVVVERAQFEEVFPIDSISGQEQSIKFRIVGSQTEYLDLNDTLLKVKVKVLNKDGGKLAATANVIPSNYLFHCLFKDVILNLNTTQIEGGNSRYAQKALISSYLNYSLDTSAVNLRPIGFDDADDTRKGWVSESKELELCGSLVLDFFNQPKYLIPGVDVLLQLIPHNSSFVLKGDGKFKITEARLFVRRVKVDPSVLLGHQVGLQKQNAIYPIRKIKTVSYSLPQGSLNFYKEQIFGDMSLPKFLLVTFQKTSVLQGDATQSSYKFHHSNVTNIVLSRNNDFREEYKLDYEKNQYTTAYVQSILRNLGYLNKNDNISLSLEDFKDELPFFTFVLSPDFDIEQTQVPRQGNLRLDITFSKALDNPVSVIIYGVFDSEIQITKNRQILS